MSVQSPSKLPTASCPAMFIVAPSSGEGKTTVTAAIARSYRNKGKNVRVFKTGPDYLDPQILAQASGKDVEPLDMWMAGEAYCQQKLYEAAEVSDLIIIEGAMGMFDGEPSSADLAARFNIPVVIVLNVKGMAQTAGAIATGLARYRSDIHVAGIIANHCSTARHEELIRDALPSDIPLLATLARDEEVTLPERHLGLVQADEVREELEVRFEKGVSWIGEQAITQLPEPVDFKSTSLARPSRLLEGKHIAIAKDAAFSFIYDANLRLLETLGASYEFFSPMSDQQVPVADALWLPGGYPELYAQKLSQNRSMCESVQVFHRANKPVLAECGGFLYCLESLTDLEDARYSMAGLMAGDGAMRGKRGCQGMQTAALPEGDVRAHAHHRSRSANTPEPIGYGKRQRHSAPGEAIYREGSLTATYLHLFFPSNAEAIAALFLGVTTFSATTEAVNRTENALSYNMLSNNEQAR
ncbi:MULTISPECIES: cobyrinate a,c-diamide synthase [unclassified Oleiphilus]|uniref:cobyrinate a,c-diamide synthase n=2 Tax=Oleiphilus TaxID=141450 RepID=UPI0007C40483|nr:MULTISPECIES: cobyrinate a,c-diamide synthase [unclassified Oleiphilus]KZY76937.1 cobyrinic acid a,c-diamide synthase [Oleiphilus sp. HI0068]KZY84758.1 cobyrinic acid a,c-diamide synthase [Oleiphilus sp. HI0069]KZY88785.1 cobyrinic acid a,c-diamide synthase [Oleiphilus sp. HI0072]KZZ10921.1 cobyrinic acid a,c-diamide synthase [Oleiphilus sp. HI0078]KZY38946.1 cobyrinic acid a,c-diamide synthase [Oleiphilus sp. HI0043]